MMPGGGTGPASSATRGAGDVSSPPLDLRPISNECWASLDSEVSPGSHSRCVVEGCACPCHPDCSPECASGLHDDCTRDFREVWVSPSGRFGVVCDCPCHLFELRVQIVDLWRRAVAA